MNKKVWITVLSLLISSLIAYNVIALFYPEQFIMCLTDTTILKMGNFIEKNVYIYWIVSVLMTGATYYLWSVIANRTFKLGIVQIITIPILIVLTYGIAHLVPELTLTNRAYTQHI